MAEPHDTDDIQGAVRKIEENLGLPAGFYNKLREDDDWSFVIKTNTLLESALTLLLADILGRTEEAFLHVLAEVDFSLKIKMTSALDIFDSSQRTIMWALLKLRNELAHNIQSVEFTFEHHLSNKDRAQDFAKKFGAVWKETFDISGHAVTRGKFVLENPRLSIWVGVLYILGDLHITLELNNLRRQSEAQRLTFASLMFESTERLAQVISSSEPAKAIASSFSELEASLPITHESGDSSQEGNAG
jgi:hypothetical protein